MSNHLLNRMGRAEKPSSLDLSKREVWQLPVSLYDNILRLSRGQPLEGLAKEIDTEARRGAGASKFSGNGLALPLEHVCRALGTTSFTAGGALVGEELGSVDDLLRPPSLVLSAGAVLLTGLEGNFSIPRAVTELTPAWLGEADVATEADGTFGSLNLVPHRITGATSISAQLDMQSRGILSTFLMQSLSLGIAAAVDKAALSGTGSYGEPEGIMYASGVGETTFGGASTWSKVLAFSEAVATANGNDQNIVWVAPAAVRTKWRNVLRQASGSDGTLWDSNSDTIAGRPAFVSQNMPATKILCGDFSKCVVAFFGTGTPVDITINPYTASTSNKIGFVATLFADTGLLRPTAFCRSTDSAVQ